MSIAKFMIEQSIVGVGLPTDPTSGNYILNIIPRTDTVANLSALTGGAGDPAAGTYAVQTVSLSGFNAY